MDQNPPVTGIRALAIKVMLEKVSELSGPQAQEMWRVMQIIETNGSLNELPGSMIQSAMDFNNFSAIRKVVEEKALLYERNTGQRKR